MGEVMKETRESWDHFSRTQKLAAVVVNGLTISRPILSGIVSKRGLDSNHEWSMDDATLLSGAYLTDLEGGIARLAGAQTKLGGILDPLADKIATGTQELVLAHRGEESYANVGIRIARDIGISALRRQALKKTAGTASVSAGWPGKANTAFRKSTIVFATSPLGNRYPRTRSALQLASAASTLLSGVATGRKLIKQINEAKR